MFQETQKITAWYNMKGRKPKPTIFKLLDGNPGKRPINGQEVIPESKIPICPGVLSETARDEWNRLAPILEKMGLISELDMAAFAAYCQAYGRWIEAEEILIEKGNFYKTPNGSIMTSPVLWVANKALEQMHKYLIEFGLTPSARSRLKIGQEYEDKEFESFEKWKEKQVKIDG